MLYLQRFKWFVGLLVVIFLGFFIFNRVFSKSIPVGFANEKAEILVDRAFSSLNKTAYDTIRILTWTFKDSHHFIWNKQTDSVEVKWQNYNVVFCTSTNFGKVYIDSKPVSGKSANKILTKAIKFFNNDSFWLVAPFKMRDEGTERKWVTNSEGEALSITYTKGGNTPGDTYLWLFDFDGKPKAWEMWVSILPVKGVRFTWEDLQYVGGVGFYTKHIGPFGIDVLITHISVQY